MSSSDSDEFWEPILEGEKDLIHIVYINLSNRDNHVDLSELEDFGLMTGMWDISEVRSCEEAIRLHTDEPADVFVILEGWRDEANLLSKSLPQLPLVIATAGGFDRFDFKQFPPQVVAASWAAPRPTEFMEVIGDALGKVATQIIYEASKSSLIIPAGLSEDLLQRLADFPEDRFLLDPRLFEEAVAELLQRMGYKTILTPRSGDKGRDVIASYETPVGLNLMLVECKRYAERRLVGPEPIARIWTRLFEDKANMAMVITTSGFSPVAKREAQQKGYQMSLKDGDQFIDWLRRYGTKSK